MTARGRRGRVAATAVGALLLSACSTTVTGTASPPETSSATPTTESQATPTEEPIEVVPPPPVGVGTVVESHRIASATALVQESFPDRTEGCGPSGPQIDAAELEAGYFEQGTAAEILDRYGFVAAWGQCNSEPDGGPATLTLALELSDPEAAVRAAEDLVAAQAVNGFEEIDLDVDGGALILQDGDLATVQAFVPVGRMVAYVFHESTAADAGTDIEQVLGDQVALLGEFEPTPQAEVPDLPPDPLGLAGFALDPPGDLRPTSGPYDLDGYLRLAIDPARERDLLTSNGFRGFYTKVADDGDLTHAVALYAFPSSAETNAVYDAFAELETTAFGGTAFTLPAIPEAPCFSFEQDGAFYQRCYVGFGSYLASIDVLGLARADEYGPMNELLPAQRDLIDG